MELGPKVKIYLKLYSDPTGKIHACINMFSANLCVKILSGRPAQMDNCGEFRVTFGANG